jgi:hypothetical protein
LERGGYLDIIGKEQIFVSQKDAIAKIIPAADEMICRSCKNPVFKECPIANRVVFGALQGDTAFAPAVADDKEATE